MMADTHPIFQSPPRPHLGKSISGTCPAVTPPSRHETRRLPLSPGCEGVLARVKGKQPEGVTMGPQEAGPITASDLKRRWPDSAKGLLPGPYLAHFPTST